MKITLCLLQRAVLVASLALVAAAAQADAPAVVDIFPAQQWGALGEPPAEPVSPPELSEQIDPDSFGAPAQAEPEQAVPPFALTGEWRAGGQRIVVLAGGPALRLLCERRCDVRGAVVPGGEVAPGYRLKRLSAREALIVGADGSEIVLTAPGLTP